MISRLEELETKIVKYDSSFIPGEWGQEQDPFPLLTRIRHGSQSVPTADSPLAEQYQVHLNVERIRVPEIFFEPAIIGVDSAGIIEAVESVLKGLQPRERELISQVPKLK